MVSGHLNDAGTGIDSIARKTAFLTSEALSAVEETTASVAALTTPELMSDNKGTNSLR